MPPIAVTFDAPVTDVPPIPTPILTIGPGQSFIEGEEDFLPELLRPDLLDSEYGYSEILGRPGLFLVWSTDEFGTKRYFVLDEDSEYLQAIITEVDKVRNNWLEMQNELPLAKAIAGAIFGVVLGVVGLVCAGGAVISLLGTPVSAPVTGGLTACAGGAFTLSAGAFGMAVDGAGRIIGHIELSDEARKEIRGAFQQIPFSEQP
ncbi:MAG: hypothetical protein ACE5M4_03135 [Anaerolineales bacterium]